MRGKRHAISHNQTAAQMPPAPTNAHSSMFTCVGIGQTSGEGKVVFLWPRLGTKGTGFVMHTSEMSILVDKVLKMEFKGCTCT